MRRRRTSSQRIVDRTRESLDSAGVPDEDVHEVLTIAAIIQREARFEDDFYKVSRVIHNRLDSDTWGDTNGLLQMDSTVQYGYGEAHAGLRFHLGRGAQRRQPVEHVRACRSACRPDLEPRGSRDRRGHAPCRTGRGCTS